MSDRGSPILGHQSLGIIHPWGHLSVGSPTLGSHQQLGVTQPWGSLDTGAIKYRTWRELNIKLQLVLTSLIICFTSVSPKFLKAKRLSPPLPHVDVHEDGYILDVVTYNVSTNAISSKLQIFTERSLEALKS